MTTLFDSQQETGRSTNGRTPVWRIEINGESQDITVIEAEFRLNEGQHDLVMLACSSDEMTDTEGLSEAPITFVYGQSPRTERFYGYIIGAVEKSGGEALHFSIVCLGSTHITQGGKPRFWENKTIPNALTDIAAVNRLGLVTSPNDYLWPSLVQTGRSDWEEINHLADRMGWMVFNRYGVVMCYDPAVAFATFGPFATLRQAAPEEILDDERHLLDFDAEEESDETPELIGTRHGYFDSRQPQIVAQEGDFTRYRFDTSTVIRNNQEATLRRSAWDLEDDFKKQKATGRLLGYADVFPGMCLDVVTSNYRIYRGKYDGRWLVIGVTHKMDRSVFQTQVSLRRPGTGSVLDVPHTPFWDRQEKPKPSMSLDLNTPLVTKNTGEGLGSWASSWSNTTIASLLS